MKIIIKLCLGNKINMPVVGVAAVAVATAEPRYRSFLFI